METAILKLRAGKRIAEHYELGIELPIISHGGGVLDSLIDAYHGAFGFPDYGRSERPSNDFLFLLSREGRAVVKGREGRTAPGDIMLSVKRNLHGGDPHASVLAFLELPTGRAKDGFGSGDWDMGLTLLMDKSLGEQAMAYVNAGVIFTDSLRAWEKVGLRDHLWGGVDIEWALSGRLNLNVQFLARQSPYKDTGIRAVDEVATVLTLGGRYLLEGGKRVEFSFSEDTSTAGAPDFMVHVGWGMDF